MPGTVHLCVFDGFADWEPAFAIAGINNPQFQKHPGDWQVKAVGDTRAPVRSMGGVAVVPDLGLEELHPGTSRMLIMPGAAGWDERGAFAQVVDKAAQFFECGVPVAAICGATAGLARAGLLDDRPHTSNAVSYLKATGYAGARHYRDEPAVRAAGLITAGGMAPIEFAREIFIELDLYDDEALDAWVQLYKTGKSEYFARFARAAQESAVAQV